MDESSIKIGKTEERLNVFYLAGFWPILYCLDFGRVHGQASGRKNLTQILNSIGVENTFGSSGIKSVCLESSEYFTDMVVMEFQIIGVDEDIIKIDSY